MQENESFVHKENPSLEDVLQRILSLINPSVVIRKYISETCHGDNVTVIGFGKAVYSMAVAVESAVQVLKGSIISIPVGIVEDPPLVNITVKKGAKNNLPDKDSLHATKEILDVVSDLGAEDHLVILISGGGSACLSGVISPMSLDKKISIIRELSVSGATINEINTVRKRLSTVKGGKLINYIPKSIRHITAFILSDVLGDPLDIIASGTTVPNTDDPKIAENILQKYNIYLNEETLSILKQVTANDQSDLFGRVKHIFVGNLGMAIDLTHHVLKNNLKYHVIQLSGQIQGEASLIGNEFGRLFLGILEGKFIIPDALVSEEQSLFSQEQFDSIISERPVTFIGGGETVVSMDPSDPKMGLGGRNQELVLGFTQTISANKEMYYNSKYKVEFISCGTDGIDGPTDAAGAVFTDSLLSDPLSIDEYLDKHDSYGYFSSANRGRNHIKIGCTGTNVLDLHILRICLKKVIPTTNN
uniref:SRP54-type proteins GTP-binding domain-containing protein n=1 Tax=Lepeophtheirus salmonis TaxID=72036 RepID=A0A0K2SXA6_LEPSM